jgi:protoheme IX farnesyltransferase
VHVEALSPAVGTPADFITLTKPRIIVLTLCTVAAGFVLGLPSPAPPFGVRLWILVNALFGTALVAGAASALNQVAERDVDALMCRTRNRPLPGRRLDPNIARWFAWTIGIIGVAQLATVVNVSTATLAALTLLVYVFVYTPLKRRSSVATLVGAVSGALPILGGWTAGGGIFDERAAALFSILFLWQLPHFLALSWMYRADYTRAGLRMLSLRDDTGAVTFGQAATYAAALIPISLVPAGVGLAANGYLVAASFLSTTFFAFAVATARAPSIRSARRLFMASLAYLPLLLAVLVADHTR